MMHQNQAPPVEGDAVTSPAEYSGPVPRPYEVWTEDDGWCSACLVEDVAIVRFGNRDRCVGICSACVARLVAARCASGLPKEGG